MVRRPLRAGTGKYVNNRHVHCSLTYPAIPKLRILIHLPLSCDCLAIQHKIQRHLAHVNQTNEHYEVISIAEMLNVFSLPRLS